MASSEKGDITRDRIITAAATLFSKKGFNNTALSQILRTAQITKGGFYFHFESKEALGLAVIDTIVRAWVENVLAESVREKDPLERLVRMFDLQNKLDSESEFSGFLLIAVLAAEMTESDEMFIERLSEMLEGWHDSVKRILERGKDMGVFRQDIDSDGLAMLILSAVEGAALLQQLDRTGRHYRSLMRSLKNNLRHLLIP
jgi:TetR/AcrR family transcriptional repressor of nem operon